MRRLSVIRMALLVVAGLALLPTAAVAQSAIAGQVRDNTGGVLPGVTVEAASPALIEGSRVVVTDGQGRYSIVSLRPGVYAVTFSLAGFGTVVREGIQLPSSFTATVDVTLTVGAIEETVTVSGQSPVVDVQDTQRTQVLSRETLDTLVSARNTWTQAMLVAGVQMTGSDVGGSQYVSDLLLEAHGADSRNMTYTIDGMNVDTMLNDGTDQNYYQDQMNQEISIQTSGGAAEVSSGGVLLNMVPKEGGNTLSGSLYLGGSSGAWESDNFSPELRAQGLRAIDRIEKIFDYGGTLGGPIVKDRLWFHVSVRYWGVDQPVTDTFHDDGSQYVNDQSITSIAPRLTYQATPRNKITVFLDRQGKSRNPNLRAKFPAVITGLGIDPETAVSWQDWRIPYGVGQAKWISTVSSRLLLEAGYSQSWTLDPSGSPLPGVMVPVGTSEWYTRVRKTDINRGVTWNGATDDARWPWRRGIHGSAAYVTGTHNLKVGTQVEWGTLEQHQTANGHISLTQYRNGVPDAVTVTNYPVLQLPRMNYDLGIYGQDQWTIDRMTVNYGVRVEWFNAQVDEQVAPAGRFVGERHFPKVPNVPDFGPDVAPRLGLAYDLFGDAKTALKFTAGKYMRAHTLNFAARLNPMAVATQSLPWTDRDLLGRTLPTNGDDIVQDNELDLTRLPTNFGERQLDRLDPNLKREYNVETSASVQHELLPNISVSAGWFRRSFHNMYVDDNVERDFNDYVPVQVVSPYNGEVFTAYNLKSATELRLVDTVVTNSKTNERIYTGFEFAAEARLPGGGAILGSSTTQRLIRNTCDGDTDLPSTRRSARDDPNYGRFCDRFNLPAPYKDVDFKSDFKLAATYPLPFGVQLSGTFKTHPARPLGDLVLIDEVLPIDWNISRTTRYTAADCAGRPCTPGALVIPGLVETSLILPLAPEGTERKLPRLTQLDFGVRKSFRVGRAEWQAHFEVFNALNADTVTGHRSNNFGTGTYGLPSSNLLGRLPRLAVQMKW